MQIEWKQIQKSNFVHLDKLADFLNLTPEHRKRLHTPAHFKLNLPLRIAQKMQKGTLDDPLFRQFVPLVDETQKKLGFVKDPVEDFKSLCEPKLLHKYTGRVLLLMSSACAMHCRYCFRKNFDYERDKSFESEIQRIGSDSTIKEVILSGGDPLSLQDEVFYDLFKKLSVFSHIKRIRFHTRFPIGIPERIDSSFIKMISTFSSRFSLFFVIHCNHPTELDHDVLRHLEELAKEKITLLNQSVLLKGVNDSVDVLQQLFETLTDHHILPYYLHQLDKVEGTTHFEVPIDEGQRLMAEVAARLPGYALPRYVAEIAGQPGKTWL